MKLYHSYEDYSKTSKNYDKTRAPIGVSLILKWVSKKLKTPNFRLLDAGCGTGSYLIALKSKIRLIAGLEFNSRMLELARQKVFNAPNIFLYQASVLAMPFANSVFDMTIFNQVTHHLDSDAIPEKQNWVNLRKAMTETHRILRPGGCLIINTCNQKQIRDGFWYTTLIPNAVEKLAKRYIPIESLCDLLIGCGFEVGEIAIPTKETFSGVKNLKNYLDPHGPLRKGWRDGDSIWSLASQKELEKARRVLRNLIKTGKAIDFVKNRDEIRQEIGQATFVQATRL